MQLHPNKMFLGQYIDYIKLSLEKVKINRFPFSDNVFFPDNLNHHLAIFF